MSYQHLGFNHQALTFFTCSKSFELVVEEPNQMSEVVLKNLSMSEVSCIISRYNIYTPIIQPMNM